MSPNRNYNSLVWYTACHHQLRQLLSNGGFKSAVKRRPWIRVKSSILYDVEFCLIEVFPIISLDVILKILTLYLLCMYTKLCIM